MQYNDSLLTNINGTRFLIPIREFGIKNSCLALKLDKITLSLLQNEKDAGKPVKSEQNCNLKGLCQKMFGPLLFCKKHYLAHINMSKEKLFVSLSILQKYLRNLLAHVVVVHADIV